MGRPAVWIANYIGVTFPGLLLSLVLTYRTVMQGWWM